MLKSTRGIVLRYVKYRETSIITTIYTEEFGMKSYIINGIRSSKSKRGMAHFQALNLLDMVVYQKPNHDIQRISEWKSSEHLLSIYTDYRKSCIAVFLSEILYKCIKEDEQNPEMFQFIFHSIVYLENMEKGFGEFHLQFLIKFARYLGFGTDNYQSLVSIEFENIFKSMANAPYGQKIENGSKNLNEILDYILQFFKEHSEGFGEVKSYKVLREVFEN